MRFNHMELTFARGTLTDAFREEVDAFYGSVFGWKSTDADVVGQRCHILLTGKSAYALSGRITMPDGVPPAAASRVVALEFDG